MANPNILRIALAGSGGVVRRYRRTYRNLPGVQVVATIDVNEGEAQQAATELNATRASTNFADVLRDDVDAVVISTPNHLHAEHAIAAFGAGKHVLLQKPMARTATECDAILAAQHRSGRTLGIYMNLLDHPLFRDMRRLVAEGKLGAVALFSARLAHRGGLGWGGVGQNWRASRETTGGGSFIQLGVHYQHLMRWLLGQDVTSVQAMATNFACPQLEGDDLMLAQYSLSKGSLGEIQTSWCCLEEHVSLLGTKGSIHYRDNRVVEYTAETGPFDGEFLHLKGDGSFERFENCLAPEWDDAANIYNQHRRFCEALQAGMAPEVSGEEAREDIRVVEACYHAARSFAQKGATA
jgi:UDP-N-acetyl-2-amino-2-deoxyglucuronate dehydrogenase